MSDQHSTSTCPRCGETGSGRFCAGCGAARGDVRCGACGASVPPGARFCPGCGVRAEADVILAARPTHLLGLVLAIRTADLRKDDASAAQYRERLVSAAPAERAAPLKEYQEHARDIDDALTRAARR